MKRRMFVLFLAVVFLFLASCKWGKHAIDEKLSAIEATATKVTEYEFYAVNLGTESGENGFGLATSAGLVTQRGQVVLDAEKTKKVRVGNLRWTCNYQYTIVEDENSQTALDNYNRGFDVYTKTNDREYHLLHGTNTICGYKKLNGTGVVTEQLSSLGYKAVADDFLYNIMPSGWKEEYESYSFEPRSDNTYFTAIYTRIIAGHKTDDVLRIEIFPWGEVCSFEGYNRNKYNDLKYSVTADMIADAENALNKRVEELELIGADMQSPTIVTNNKGELYLKKQISFTDSGRLCTDLIFVKVSADKLVMTDEYKAMIEANFEINNKIDTDPKTTTKNRLINDQSGANISKFQYGSFAANYNACGAIAVHNAKVLLNKTSSLSQTIYDIQNTSALVLGGIAGSNTDMVPEIMKKYGIKCTVVSPDRMNTVGVYIISFWQNSPPWNGTHTVAVYYDGNKHTAYNYKGDGSVNKIVPTSFGDKMIVCYKIG